MHDLFGTAQYNSDLSTRFGELITDLITGCVIGYNVTQRKDKPGIEDMTCGKFDIIYTSRSINNGTI